MTTHPTTHRPSAGEGLHTYGLAGIDLQRVAERRFAGEHAHRVTGEQPGTLHRVRQLAGDAMIRLGASIAGDAATPVAPRSISPRADMA